MFQQKYFVRIDDPGLVPRLRRKIALLKAKWTGIGTVRAELCYYVKLCNSTEALSESDVFRLKWIFSHPPRDLSTVSHSTALNVSCGGEFVVEIGPRLNFSTPFSTNVVAILRNVGVDSIERVEVSTRYLVQFPEVVEESVKREVAHALHDKMTECVYDDDIFLKAHFDAPDNSLKRVPVISEGRSALAEINKTMGLGFDDWDLNCYTEMFRKLGRDPTVVECFDLAQSNSEHSRHWFFKGDLFIDGTKVDGSLFDMIMATQEKANANNVIKFSDNSSAIDGFSVRRFCPSRVDDSAEFSVVEGKRHIVLTAETHNFPTAISPFSGAATGTGGRIRDVQAVGRGGHVIAASAGYCFGNVQFPGVEGTTQPSLEYPYTFATPLEVAIEASNGASDYGNKFGEPVILGFVRSFGLDLRTETGFHKEWMKPIMFSAGIGALDEYYVTKAKPEKGMQVIKVGGPPYRVGIGGGAASSIQVQGDSKAELDFNAVQRGDPEMEQKMNRVIRGSIEAGLTDPSKNPIQSIHDQGAGGNGNVLKELVEPAGAVIKASNFTLGDPTMNAMEIWGAEYQESNALLCARKDLGLLESIAKREKCPIDVVGEVTGDGQVIFEADRNTDKTDSSIYAVDLPLDVCLGSLPKKSFKYELQRPKFPPFKLPEGTELSEVLDLVLSQTAVCSKRWLTNKVDRSVTGLVAQQQCVGPLHTPIADVAVVALSYFDTVGAATSIGEQPIKILVSPEAGARMSVAEMITNMAGAPITDLRDVKCSGNWMWAAKVANEGANLVIACQAMCEVMKVLGVAIDGGKDSLSMAARDRNGETIVSPGALVISGYAPCEDIRKVITPDLKQPYFGRRGKLILVRPWDPKRDLKWRNGGSALAQSFQQVGCDVPDLDYPERLAAAFGVVQRLVKEGTISAIHDISDGGLIVSALEMAFAGFCSLDINVSSKIMGTTKSIVDCLFSEEVGWVLEVEESSWERVVAAFVDEGVFSCELGTSSGFGKDAEVTIKSGSDMLVNAKMTDLMQKWEKTSFHYECQQMNPVCAEAEFASMQHRKKPAMLQSLVDFKLEWNDLPPVDRSVGSGAIRVCVLREEGCNGDREMAASLHLAGFEVHDVTMYDLIEGNVTLDRFRGLIFPGGFSYADVLGSAKGWAANLILHPSVREQFTAFKNRKDTFSLGVCNGCQLMALADWIVDGEDVDPVQHRPGFYTEHNTSGRFESRFSFVKIEESTSIFFKGLGGAMLGVWVAHGEGKFEFRDEAFLKSLVDDGRVALRYCDDLGNPTEEYPLNPNGSSGGIAGLLSADGRHLAMMPHPERCVYWWQWPFLPHETRGDFSPWMQFFKNAFNWCQSNV